MKKIVLMIFFLVAYSLATKMGTGRPYMCNPSYHGAFGYELGGPGSLYVPENILETDEKSAAQDEANIVRLIEKNSQKYIYGSTKLMPVVGEMKAVKKELKCYYIAYSKSKNAIVNDAYVAFATNIPQQVKKTAYDIERCDVTGKKCQHESEYSFFTCRNSEPTEKGCLVTEKGMELIVMRSCNKAHIASTNKDGLLFYLKLRDLPFGSESYLDFFVDYVKSQNYDEFKVTVPYGATEQDFFKVGNEAVQIAPGIDYYMDGKYIESVTFEKSPFKNIQEISDHCYDWGKKQLEKMEKK
ncbi:MAG: hypothetical protein MJZ76_11375 [Bacteroidales bacterium]|nr:hypothetical protein [Bacteroidales bacterium]